VCGIELKVSSQAKVVPGDRSSMAHFRNVLSRLRCESTQPVMRELGTVDAAAFPGGNLSGRATSRA